jgi:hypothetical protein
LHHFLSGKSKELGIPSGDLHISLEYRSVYGKVAEKPSGIQICEIVDNGYDGKNVIELSYDPL